MIPRKSWHRVTLSLVGIVIIASMWRWSVDHLYSLPPETFSAFTSLTTHSQYVIGAIVIFMVTGRLIYEWKLGSTTEAISEAVTQTIKETKETKDVQIIQQYAEKYKDDPSYRPIEKEEWR